MLKPAITNMFDINKQIESLSKEIGSFIKNTENLQNLKEIFLKGNFRTEKFNSQSKKHGREGQQQYERVSGKSQRTEI